MNIISFDIEGKFAHFRKFYGNNTAMSYSIPPRTTIIGILAAILGMKRDTYYKSFQDNNLKIGIRVLSDLKKSFHRLNFLMIKSKDDFRGKKGRIQTPFEVVTGHDINKDSVKYRFYLAPGKDESIYQQINQRLFSINPHFSLSLGIANFSAFISNIKNWNSEKKTARKEWLNIHSACNSEQVEEIDFPNGHEFKLNYIEEELLPADFIGGDKGREVYRMNRVLFTTRNFPIRINLNGIYYQIYSKDSKGRENIQFLEYAGVFSQQAD